MTEIDDGDGSGPPGRDRARPHGKRRRRLSGVLALGLALLAVGGLYTVAAPHPQVATAQPDAGLIAKGRQLYTTTCITCHGSNLQGVQDRGPSLIGVGDAAVYFQVSSGRMPLAGQTAQARRKPPVPEFDPGTPEGRANLEALGAYVQANGGGPQAPVAGGPTLIGDDPAHGGELFRLNCASCHNFTGRGGALVAGTFGPELDPATPAQVYTAMLTGPQNMPRFSDEQLKPQEKRDIIAYVLSVRGNNNSPGGLDLGGIGPTSEGVVAFVVGMAALIGLAVWLGAKN